MAHLTISEVAKQMDLRPSAIRYYERIGILPPAYRKGGRRCYDNAILRRLAVIRRARQTGFSLDEIRELFFGLEKDSAPSKRWIEMSQRKIAELDSLVEQIQITKNLLFRLQKCRCYGLDECGQKMLQQGVTKAGLIVL